MPPVKVARNLRKGTFSCWECKRRKTKCLVDHPSDSICASCRYRGADCVSQQYPDPADKVEDVAEDRIAQIETLVGELVRKRTITDQYPTEQREVKRRVDAQVAYIIEQFDLEGANIQLSFPTTLTMTLSGIGAETNLRHQLLALLPRPEKIALILDRGKYDNLPIQIRNRPFSPELPAGQNVELSGLSQPSLQDAHPLKLARQLIQMALCLQQIETPAHQVPKHYIEAASRLVTSQDALVDSVEGIQTLMLECFYYINTGDTRKAWLVIRRAIAIAQMHGLHQTSTQNPREEVLWSRLVLGDCYFSWMLGVQHAISASAVQGVSQLVEDVWASKLEQAHMYALDGIISRNLRMKLRSRKRLLTSFETPLDPERVLTQQIDEIMCETAESLPASWWARPTLKGNPTSSDNAEKTERLIAKMHHHFILVILHQPWALGAWSTLLTGLNNGAVSFSSKDHECSQKVTIAACRELLLEFVVLRSFHRTLYYRGADDKVFIAAVMLTLFYIDVSLSVFSIVSRHQQSDDLGLVHEVANILEELGVVNRDDSTASLGLALKQLVDYKGCHGEMRSHRITMEDTRNLAYDFKVGDCIEDFRFTIPYFGTIRLTSDSISEAPISNDVLGMNNVGNADLYDDFLVDPSI